MTNLRRGLVAFLLGLLLSPNPKTVHAYDLGPYGDAYGFEKPYLFGGLHLGLASLGSDISGEGDKSGFQFALRGSGTVYIQAWVLDLGAGWFYNRVQGTNSRSQEVTITTRAGFAEFSPRYRLLENVQLGPILSLGFGPDLGFSPTLPGQSTAFFGGVQAFYEIKQDDNRMRFGARWTMDLNVPAKALNVFMVGFEFGFPIKMPAPASAPEPLPVVEPAPLPSPFPLPPPAPVVKAKPKPDLKIELTTKQIHFEFNSASLDRNSRRYLNKLGKFLGANSKLWQSLEIAGHTDQRGSFKYNMKLSVRRAESVKKALAAGGAPSKKLKPEGFSEAVPLVNENTEAAWAKNRRVELRFFGVKDPAKLKEQLEEAGDKPVNVIQ